MCIIIYLFQFCIKGFSTYLGNRYDLLKPNRKKNYIVQTQDIRHKIPSKLIKHKNDEACQHMVSTYKNSKVRYPKSSWNKI